MLKVYCQNVWNSSPASYRNKLIRSLIEDADADICLFQECGPKTNRAAKVSLPDLMKDIYGEVREEFANFNYTPIYYKREKFRLIDSGYFLYDGLNDENSKTVTWAVFEEKSSSVKFAAISTHFWWMFESEEDNQQRLRNVDQLYEICDSLVKKYSVTVIVGGDLNNGKNSEQGDEPYRYMKTKDVRIPVSAQKRRRMNILITNLLCLQTMIPSKKVRCP